METAYKEINPSINCTWTPDTFNQSISQLIRIYIAPASALLGVPDRGQAEKRRLKAPSTASVNKLRHEPILPKSFDIWPHIRKASGLSTNISSWFPWPWDFNLNFPANYNFCTTIALEATTDCYLAHYNNCAIQVIRFNTKPPFNSRDSTTDPRYWCPHCYQDLHFPGKCEEILQNLHSASAARDRFPSRKYGHQPLPRWSPAGKDN